MRIDEITNYYHATYRPLIDSILRDGLGNTKVTNWEDSVPGIVYLARDPEVAISYAETVENIPEEWLDEIVLITIPTTLLEPTKIKKDRNVLDDDSTIEYHGIIPVTKNMIT